MKKLLKMGMIISLMALASCAHHQKCGCKSECKPGQQCSLEKKSCCEDASKEAKPEAAATETKK